MVKNSIIPKIETYGDATTTAFGYELIRSILLPDILGEDQDSLLYWAGRKIARLYPLAHVEDIIDFFEKAGWGELTLESKTKDQMTFILSSDLVSARIKSYDTPSFTLEAGFLGEQIQRQTGYAAETQHEIKTGKQKLVKYNVKWDRKDQVVYTEANI